MAIKDSERTYKPVNVNDLILRIPIEKIYDGVKNGEAKGVRRAIKVRVTMAGKRTINGWARREWFDLDSVREAKLRPGFSRREKRHVVRRKN
jgi:hypothetical protein